MAAICKEFYLLFANVFHLVYGYRLTFKLFIVSYLLFEWTS